MQFDVTPEQASHGRSVRDDELPLLAAHWLALGHDSPTLREVAGLSRREGTEARQLLPSVLAELGHPLPDRDSPWEHRPWRGYWEQIWWAVDQIGKTHSPYASAQRVLEVLDDVPDLWEPGGGVELAALLAEWDAHPSQRTRLDQQIRQHLRSLHEHDVPPLS